ncbi:MAG: alpha/beta hydrolase-fold protein [Gammaproteobacteria bacterium]|jgi:poly(3-hydroxybutyrate) depolymerase|nr:poly(3-hydroxybutyrate) depolymerase [Gammaproteobacteria bacterium]MDP6097924.1 alpha/beta hydrolase-fold protein [Gammaproteobacteria bacterium]HJO12364.1 alpha/beta hydrolase-fold protein [Gammaproteobacteria bacterium]|tara:strand:- start:1728 stop:2528 length:801 start_codon:yes stop_codon:yes gene_type:complete
MTKVFTKSVIFFAFLLFSAAGIAQSLLTSTVLTRDYHFAAAGKNIEYTLFVPGSYNANEETALLVLLHGLGSNPQQVINYTGIQEQAEEHGYIVVAPFGYNERGWYGTMNAAALALFSRDDVTDPDNMGELSEQDVLNVLDIIEGEFNIDSDRTYLMGHSMGGGGTYHIGMKYADKWAALAPMAPAIYSSPDDLEKIRDMPIIVVQGDQDELVPVAIARNWVAKMAELNMTHKYIEIAGGDHVSSITENPEMIAEIFQFFNDTKIK